MFESFDEQKSGSELLGLRITAGLVALTALVSCLRSMVHLVASILHLWGPGPRPKHNPPEFVLFAGLTYALVRISSGLVDGRRWARDAAQIWGGMLLIWIAKTVVFPTTYDPKAPDADELLGPLIAVVAPIGIWLIAFLSVPGVRKRFA